MADDGVDLTIGSRAPMGAGFHAQRLFDDTFFALMHANHHIRPERLSFEKIPWRGTPSLPPQRRQRRGSAVHNVRGRLAGAAQGGSDSGAFTGPVRITERIPVDTHGILPARPGHDGRSRQSSLRSTAVRGAGHAAARRDRDDRPHHHDLWG